MDGDGSVVISDFGVSGWVKTPGNASQKLDSFTGTPCWMAPEVISSSDSYDSKADIWSLGITALELAKGYAPYAMYDPAQVMKLIVMENSPTLKTYDVLTSSPHSSKFSKQFNEIVALCLQKNPKHRPSASALLKKSYFRRARSKSTLVTDLLNKQAIKDIKLQPSEGRSPLPSALKNCNKSALKHKHAYLNQTKPTHKHLTQDPAQPAHLRLPKRESSLWDFSVDDLAISTEEDQQKSALGSALAQPSGSGESKEAVTS